MEKTCISVIIPALNESAHITRAVESAWRLPADEVLVVDGGSYDDSIEKAIAANAKVLRHEPGRGAQMNRGAQEAIGNVLVFLHADNRFTSNCGPQLRRAMQDETHMFGAFAQRIDSPRTVYRWIERGNAMRVRCLRLPYGDQAIFVRNDAFEQAGRFPEVALMEDVLLMRKLRRESKPVLLPGPVVVSARRWESHGPLRQTLHNWRLLAAEKLGANQAWLGQAYSSRFQVNAAADAKGETGQGAEPAVGRH